MVSNTKAQAVAPTITQRSRKKARFRQFLPLYLMLLPGFIAEDVEEIYPSAVIHQPDTGLVETWDEKRIIPGMLALIQEQDEKIKKLEAEMLELRAMIMEMREGK